MVTLLIAVGVHAALNIGLLVWLLRKQNRNHGGTLRILDKLVTFATDAHQEMVDIVDEGFDDAQIHRLRQSFWIVEQLDKDQAELGRRLEEMRLIDERQQREAAEAAKTA